jgi:hypothetical protein
MNNAKRGLAIVFNHQYYYNKNLPIRIGTDKDADNLDKTFSSLGFDVIVHKDPILSDIEYVIEKSMIKLM